MGESWRSHSPIFMEEEINLLDCWRVILKWKKIIFFIVIACTLVSIVISLFLTKIYKTEATLMPVGGKSSGLMGAAVAQMGLGGLMGGLGGSSSSSSQLLAILKSRTLAEQVIEKQGLMKVFYGKIEDPTKMPHMEDAVKMLFSQVNFTDDRKSQLIIIQGEMKDPQLVAQVVNGYITALIEHLNKNAFTSAKRNRLFIEEQLGRNKAELLESGRDLNSFYTTNKISNVIPTVDVDVSLGGEQVEAGAQGLQNTVEDFKKKTQELDNKIQQAHVVKDVPQQVYLQYLTLRRELLGQVNSLLTQQYEMAKIEEAKEDLNFQIIDWARIPVGKFKPKISQIVMISFIMSLFLSIFYVFFREYLEKVKISESREHSQGERE